MKKAAIVFAFLFLITATPVLADFTGGTVTDTAGKPMQNILLKFYRYDTSYPISEVITGADGKYFTSIDVNYFPQPCWVSLEPLGQDQYSPKNMHGVVLHNDMNNNFVVEKKKYLFKEVVVSADLKTIAITTGNITKKTKRVRITVYVKGPASGPSGGFWPMINKTGTSVITLPAKGEFPTNLPISGATSGDTLILQLSNPTDPLYLWDLWDQKEIPIP